MCVRSLIARWFLVTPTDDDDVQCGSKVDIWFMLFHISISPSRRRDILVMFLHSIRRHQRRRRRSSQSFSMAFPFNLFWNNLRHTRYEFREQFTFMREMIAAVVRGTAFAWNSLMRIRKCLWSIYLELVHPSDVAVAVEHQRKHGIRLSSTFYWTQRILRRMSSTSNYNWIEVLGGDRRS